MRLIFVRHGETEHNRQRRVQGQSDVKLNKVGKSQAEAIAQALREERIQAIYTSPLGRCLETAQTINRFHGIAIEVEDSLKELDTGGLEGLTAEEMISKHGRFWQQWHSDQLAWARFPSGETLAEAQQRSWATIERIKERHDQETVLVAGHQFIIMVTVLQALQLDLSHFRRLRPLDNGAITILDFGNSRITLMRYNDACHLTGEYEGVAAEADPEIHQGTQPD